MNPAPFPLEVGWYACDGLAGRVAAFRAADPRTVAFLRLCRRLREHGLDDVPTENIVRYVSVDSLRKS